MWRSRLSGSGLLFGTFIAVGLLYQSLFSGAAERLVTIALIDAIIVLGIQIYVGNTGVLSFGHIGFGGHRRLHVRHFRHRARPRK